MNKRQTLALVVRSMLLVLALSFMYIFFRGIGGAQVEDLNGGEQEAIINKLLVGQTTLRRYAGKRVWISRLSPEQRQQASQVESYLSSATNGCDKAAPFCVIVAATGQVGIELSFTELAPAQLPSEFLWFGGFVNPGTGAVYDRLGRPYRIGLEEFEVLELMDFANPRPAHSGLAHPD